MLEESEVFDEKRILRFCLEAAHLEKVFAACAYGPKAYGYVDEEAALNVLLVARGYAPGIRNFFKRLSTTNLFILAVDKDTFESDVEQGKFGEFVADVVTFPYQPWKNRVYLEEMEVRTKRRLVLELLRIIVLRYPEMSMELLVKPEYFVFEVIRRKARLFPLSKYGVFNMFEKRVKKQHVDSILKGYLKSLKGLERENYVKSTNGYVQVTKDFVEAAKLERNRFSNILMSVQEALSPYILGLSSRVPKLFLQDRKLFTLGSRKKTEEEQFRQLEETEKYLLMPTPLGPVPLSQKASIQDFVRKIVSDNEVSQVSITEMGGVLNSVFLLRLKENRETKKIVVKKFEDWLGLKWFPLALWTLGTKSFAVLGKTRLEREYSINTFLAKQGFVVPRILYVSLKDRLIFEDFVEGRKTSDIIKEMIAAPSKENVLRTKTVVKAVGREIARVHALNIALGDSKPENILITSDDRVCLLDLEQATRNGNQPWDIAEFLYYSGHYILPIHADEAAEAIASSFIEGYLEAGGRKRHVKKAASVKYTKVFSVFTLPHIILAMARICIRKGEEN